MTKSQRIKASRLESIIRSAKEDLQRFRSFHGAGIWDGKMVAIAFNDNKGDRKAKDHFPFPSDGIHAEFKAILRAGHRDFTKCEIYVARIGNHGMLANSKPCKWCESVIKQLRFKRVFFSTENGWQEL